MINVIDKFLSFLFQPFIKELDPVEVESVEWVDEDRVEITTVKNGNKTTTTALVFDKESVEEFRSVGRDKD